MAIPRRRGQPAELRGGADEHQATGTQQLVVVERDQVQTLAVAAVALLTHGHSLLQTEHVVAKGQGRLELLVGADAADLEARILRAHLHVRQLYIRASA